jgi:hypothetical protein
MVRPGDRHYLFYSANAYYKPEYGVAYAECEGLAGPCKKPAGNYVLGNCAFSLSPPLKGPGHQSVIEADGRTFITYHTLVPSPDGAGFTGDRQLHVNELAWAETGPMVRLPGEQPSSLAARCGKQVQHRALPP